MLFVGYGVFIGQNLAWDWYSSPSWERSIENWYEEVAAYKYGQDPEIYLGHGGFAYVGHYTQVLYCARGVVVYYREGGQEILVVYTSYTYLFGARHHCWVYCVKLSCVSVTGSPENPASAGI